MPKWRWRRDVRWKTVPDGSTSHASRRSFDSSLVPNKDNMSTGRHTAWLQSYDSNEESDSVKLLVTQSSSKEEKKKWEQLLLSFERQAMQVLVS
jgi:hypothetical protein